MVEILTYKPQILSPYIVSIWHLTIPDVSGQKYSEEIVPDGHHELIFHVGSQRARRVVFGEWVTEPKDLIAAQNLKSYSLELKAGSRLYGIRFNPHTLAFLFDLPVAEITDQIISLDNLACYQLLRSCITEKPEVTFLLLEKALSKYIYNADFTSTRFKHISHSINKIFSQKGNITIDSLITNANMSAKYFDLTFKKYVGINPKAFCNIVRLNYFINYKNCHPDKSLTECCYEASYFDQAHFNNYFKSTIGENPSAYFKHRNFINNTFLQM